MIQLLLGAFIFISAPVFMKNRIKAFSIPLMALYVLEAMLLVSIWTVVSLPFVYMDQKFSTAVYVYIMIVLVFYIGLLGYAFTRHYRRNIGDNRLKEIIDFIKDNKEICIFAIVLIGYQLLRCTFLQTDGYRDSKTYIALINDMVDTNRFFLLDDVYGKTGISLEEVSPKYILSGWYTFEAVISYVSGLHPLIVVNTVLPPVIMLFSYMSYWLLSEVLFARECRKKVLFIIFIALIFQFLADDTGALFMIWPTWGKNLVLSISIPMYLHYYFQNQLEETYKNCLLLLITFFACFVSTTGIVVLSILIIGCNLYSCLIKKQVRLMDGVSILIQMIPVIIYVLVYKMW